jgi:hypothetical protein
LPFCYILFYSIIFYIHYVKKPNGFHFLKTAIPFSPSEFKHKRPQHLSRTLKIVLPFSPFFRAIDLATIMGEMFHPHLLLEEEDTFRETCGT